MIVYGQVVSTECTTLSKFVLFLLAVTAMFSDNTSTCIS